MFIFIFFQEKPAGKFQEFTKQNKMALTSADSVRNHTQIFSFCFQNNISCNCSTSAAPATRNYMALTSADLVTSAFLSFVVMLHLNKFKCMTQNQRFWSDSHLQANAHESGALPLSYRALLV